MRGRERKKVYREEGRKVTDGGKGVGGGGYRMKGGKEEEKGVWGGRMEGKWWREGCGRRRA